MTIEMIFLLIMLTILVILFITEWLRVDVIAIMSMLALIWMGILTPSEAFSGFSGSAVISVIAVMILGYGVEQSGIMKKITIPIIKYAGKSENKLISLISLTVGGISSFLQNIGAAALFLPAIRRICRQSKISASRLLMPMGFAAILGGTVTMVGSGPLILLNDLLNNAQLSSYSLFGSTPIGIVLLFSGVLYFVLGGKKLLPKRSVKKKSPHFQKLLIDTFNLNSIVHLMRIPNDCPLVGKTREEAQIWEKYQINLLAIADEKEVDYAPWRLTRFSAGQGLALFGCKDEIQRFYNDFQLEDCLEPKRFNFIMNPDSAGFAEIIILPGSKIVGSSLRDVAMRKNFDVEPVLLLRGNEQYRGDFSDIVFNPGDIIVIYGLWGKIAQFKDNENFILASPIEGESPKPYNTLKVSLIMAGIIAGVVVGIKLPVILLSGVVLMLISKVINMDDAYKAIDWRTVFLIAGLIPLGIAMEKTGTALFISNHMMSLLQGSPIFIILLAIALLTTLFSLFMSNVAATVLLVPLVINIAQSISLDPRPMALLVAICTANSFLIPTHQVNAFLMSPGGYHTRDYIKIGGLMSFIFIIISVSMIYLFYI